MNTPNYLPASVFDDTFSPEGDILIVDDTPANLDLLSNMLVSRQFHIRVATTGKRALSIVAANPPELILLDIKLPDLNGFEVCRALRETPAASIPIIFISALDDTQDKVEAFRVGGVDYITKPFQEEEVIARIESQIRIARLQRELIRKHDELARTNALLDQQRGELTESNLKLREIDEQKAGFTAMLVHDLKSPLAVVKATFEFLQTNPSIMTVLKAEALDSFIEASIYNLDRVLDLVGEVLDVFRSETQELHLLKMPTDLARVLNRCLEQASVMAGGKKITVEAPDLPDTVLLDVDSGKIERVFSNLLSNAVKFTAKGGTVRLEAAYVSGEGVEAGTRWFRVTVTDTGAGIPPEDLPYIFDPYRQTSATKGRVGVGLGLAIVKRIVAAHGGSVSVRSKVGVGSAFTVELPVV